MTGKQKKELIKEMIESGDKRTYNAAMADLELEIWTVKHKGQAWVDQKLGRNKDERNA